MDVLRELATIGAGHAATAISKMAGKRIDIEVPEVYGCSVEEVPAIVGKTEVVLAVRLEFDEEKPGTFFLLLKEEDALPLLALMLGRKVERIGELESSAILEFGNILAGAFLSAVANFLDGVIRQYNPSMKVDMIGAILDETLAEYGRGIEKVWLTDVSFAMEGNLCNGRLLFMPFFDFMHEVLKR